MTTETASFGAGCFWGVEATFRRVPGVVDVAVGYMGGALDNPSYQAVCTDTTGHAEVVQIQFNPAQCSYTELLRVFWSTHDPTTRNRQGPDIGSQYRSAVFYHTPQQQAQAIELKMLLNNGQLRKPVVTEITPAQTFWRAEEYHQRYLEKKGLAHCHI